MKAYLMQHLPILQILVPFLGGVIMALLRNIRAARAFFKGCALLGLLLSACGAYYLDEPYSYALGGWQAPFGIVFYLDIYNQMIILYSYFILAFLAFAGHNLMAQQLEPSMREGSRHLIYCFILLYHFASIGICSTDDFFNLYVFLEIASLAAYTLFALGSKEALVTALEYLIIGTIAATLLLLGVGVIYSQTGHLNMALNKEWLMQMNSSAHYLALILMTVGVMIKLALFPFHHWLSRCYQHMSLPLMVYIPSIASVVNTYIICKFIFYIMGIDALSGAANLGYNLILFVGVGTILCLPLMAATASNLRQILAYSAIGKLGYVFVILAALGNWPLVVATLIADGLVKASLFYTMNLLSLDGISLALDRVKNISSKLIVALCIVIFMSSALPLSSGFIIKFTMLHNLFLAQSYYIFAVVIFASLVGLWYHYKMISIICFRNINAEHHSKEAYGILPYNYEVIWVLLPILASFSAIIIL